jgi:hypothetical protein
MILGTFLTTLAPINRGIFRDLNRLSLKQDVAQQIRSWRER